MHILQLYYYRSYVILTYDITPRQEVRRRAPAVARGRALGVASAARQWL